MSGQQCIINQNAVHVKVFHHILSVAILGNLFLMIKCSGLWKKCGYVTGLGFLTFTIGAFISFAKLGLLVKRYNKL